MLTWQALALATIAKHVGSALLAAASAVVLVALGVRAYGRGSALDRLVARALASAAGARHACMQTCGTELN